MLMAKKDSKSSDGSTATATADGAPVFSADALSKLTQRIQTDFDKAKSGAGANKGVKQSGKKDKKEKGKGSNATAKDQKNNTPSKSGDKPNERSAVNSRAQDGPSSKPGAHRNNEKRRGKDAVGPSKNPKPPVSTRQETQKRKHASPANAKPKSSDPFPKKAGTGRIDKEALLREIVELGGTQEDLALVADIESDDSQEEVVIQDAGNSAKDVNKKDIEAFMKEIGLDIGKVEDAEESAVEEEWQNESEDDRREEEDESEEDSDGDIKMEESTPVVSTREKGSNVGSKLVLLIHNESYCVVTDAFISCSQNDPIGTLNNYLLCPRRLILPHSRPSRPSTGVGSLFSRLKMTFIARRSWSNRQTGSS
jgi:ribosome biogenesis protein MAK21